MFQRSKVRTTNKFKNIFRPNFIFSVLRPQKDWKHDVYIWLNFDTSCHVWKHFNLNGLPDNFYLVCPCKQVVQQYRVTSYTWPWYHVNRDLSSVHDFTVEYTSVTFDKLQNNTAMFIWSGCSPYLHRRTIYGIEHTLNLPHRPPSVNEKFYDATKFQIA